MVTTEYSKTRVFIYMSKLWEEHASLDDMKNNLESGVTALKAKLRKLERNWIGRFTVKAVRNSIKRLKKELGHLQSELTKVKERCSAIAQTTGSWASVFAN